MKIAPVLSRPYLLLGLAAAGTALLPVSRASAQSLGAYTFSVNNLTSSNGDPVYSVYDSVTFSGVQINEVFADGYAQPLGMPDIQTTDITPSSAQVFSFANGVYSDPVHGALTSATLTGTLKFPGFSPTNTLMLTLQPSTDPSSQYQQSVFTPFTASLFGPAPAGVAVGAFSLLNTSTGQGTQVNIDALPVPAAVPEASPAVSFGLLMALGLGAFTVTRRRTARIR